MSPINLSCRFPCVTLRTSIYLPTRHGHGRNLISSLAKDVHSPGVGILVNFLIRTICSRRELHLTVISILRFLKVILIVLNHLVIEVIIHAK
jgi:hypothetical protein